MAISVTCAMRSSFGPRSTTGVVIERGPFWDRLFADGERFEIGSLAAKCVLVNHTLASILSDR
jgi:hypothetical protein